jgi:hypothetical protein
MKSLCIALLLAGCSSERAHPTASERGPARDREPESLQGAPAGGVLHLGPGTIVHGVLEEGDRALVDGSLGDDYALTLAEGEVITIVVRGGESRAAPDQVLDMQGFLLFNGQEVMSDDDSAMDGDARNARMVFSPPVRGFYVLRVTTSGPGPQEGEYDVQVYPDGRLLQR